MSRRLLILLTLISVVTGGLLLGFYHNNWNQVVELEFRGDGRKVNTDHQFARRVNPSKDSEILTLEQILKRRSGRLANGLVLKPDGSFQRKRPENLFR